MWPCNSGGFAIPPCQGFDCSRAVEDNLFLNPNRLGVSIASIPLLSPFHLHSLHFPSLFYPTLACLLRAFLNTDFCRCSSDTTKTGQNFYFRSNARWTPHPHPRSGRDNTIVCASNTGIPVVYPPCE